MSKLLDKRGRLTSYALACGYVDTYPKGKPIDAPATVRLWREHGCYFVQGAGAHTLEGFSRLSAARRRVRERLTANADGGPA